MRSTAQLISYELILSSVIIVIILLTGNLNIITIVESQRIVDFLLPLFPLFIIFFIGSIAETNRAPFDLAEAESELVSGFMTEHSASVFVFFFLAEYASIILICVLNSILFFGGYLCIIPVDICPNSINGVSTCFAPICINTKKLATNTKNAILLKGLNCTPLNLDKSVNGIAIKAKIAANIAITPNNLLGIDLNIA